MNKKTALSWLFFVILLTGCTQPSLTPSATVLPSPPVISPSAPPPSTQRPATATAVIPKVILVASDGGGIVDSQAVRGVLTELVAPFQWMLEVRPGLQPGEVSAQVKVVVLLAQPANLAELMAASPTTQFVVITAGELAAKGSLSVVRFKPEHLAFVAGFSAALISPDLRAAGLLPDQPRALLEAFQNGGRYFCGRCTPNFAPMVLFPVGAVLPQSSALPAWQDAFEKLKKNIIQTVYVPAEISTPELLDYLMAQKVTLIGGKTPTEALKPRWAATVKQDALATLRAIWADVAGGKGGKQASAAITLSDVNETLFSVGKQRLVQEVILGLSDGTIKALSVTP